MRRVVVRSWATVDELVGLPVEEAADPTPAAGQVVVTVEAANVSYVEALTCTGRYQFTPALPYTPGTEIAGTITAVGDGLDRELLDRRVVAAASAGCASHVVIAADAAVELPADVGAPVAASIVQSYGTVRFAFTTRTTVRPDENVVVLGAGGAVGLAAIDLAKAAGARVVACASTDAKLDLARAAGADATIGYGDAPAAFDLKTAIRDLTGGGADIVVDPVGGDLAEPALRALRFGGRYLVIGFAAGPIPRLPTNQILLNNRAVIGVELGGWARRHPAEHRALTADVIAMAAAGTVHPVEPMTFPLDDTGRLLHALLTRQLAGRAVVIP